MKNISHNKRKIFNDPIYGFINISDDLIFDIIEHPYFQRLRRIKQLGLTHLVYPGALHTRFHHAIGAMHLMDDAIQTLRSKDIEITDEEEVGALIAILLHDIGHGPFSHALEHSIISDINHEVLSELFMQKLNNRFGGQLDFAIKIFQNQHNKTFLHQLISGQLDVDRLDYLKRDSFYTGVSEGVINTDRIIKMLNVFNDELVVEAKGIYSIEKFIVARRLMYWQVYLHKTVISAEKMLVKVLERAKYLALNGTELFCTPALKHFLYNDISRKDLIENESLLDLFSSLDDYDIYTSLKVWVNHSDFILSYLANCLINRNLYRIEILDKPVSEERKDILRKQILEKFPVSEQETKYFLLEDVIENNAYTPYHDRINILQKDGSISDISEAFDQLNVAVLAKTVTKYFLCFPKLIS